MRRSSPLNVLLVTIAAAAALVLTVVHPSPREVKAAPGEAVVLRHDLTKLKIFNRTLLRIKERYVDPTRIDPRKMLYQALDSVQFNIPEVLVEPDEAHNSIAVRVNDKREVFDTSGVDSPWRLGATLRKVFRFVETNMNAGADLAEVEYAAVNGMLSTLDPHSILMDPEAARDMDVSTSGKFGGLGIVIRMIDRRLTVVRPMKDTPASRAGIRASDHIVKINDEPTDNLTSDEAVDRMRGEPKTAVTLWIQRKGESQLRRFDLVRAVIRVSSVESKLLDKKVGLIKIKQFSSTTSTEVAQAMDDLKALGASAWVLDLRWNPGGLLEESVEVADLFVDTGAVVTTVSSRRREVHDASRGPGDAAAPLAVLVNGGSASASEIVAGALKNLDRALIIGTRTFGKGSVQELYDNEDGSKLKLTVAQYLTPGDRSIQSVGIVPDVLLQRMVVPDKNDGTRDLVRLLAPSRTYGEKDLDAHLVSTYAHDADKPAHELPFLVDKPKKAAQAAGPDAPGGEDPADPEPVDEDEIVEDFEIRFARDAVASAASVTRPGMVKDVKRLVDRLRAEEETKLVAALGKIGVDWTAAPPAQAAPARLAVKLDTAPAVIAKAGEEITLTGTVTNQGTGPAWRVHARVQAEDYVFEDAELPFGKLAPGETRSFRTKVQVPKDAVDRLDRLTLEVREARNATAVVAPATIRIEASPRPVFAYAYQLLDDGNGDGLVQRNERYRLQVTVKNTGAGAATEATALLRNASGDGVALDRSRFELGELKAGQSRTLEFPFAVTGKLRTDELALEVMMYDGVLGGQANEKLRFAVRPAVSVVEAKGTVEVTARAAEIRSGAATDTAPVGTAAGRSRFTCLATVGPFTKVDLGSGRIGYIETGKLARRTSTPAPLFQPFWNSTPPTIAVNLKGLDTTAATYKLEGQITDDTHVEDVYVFVSNATAKIDSRKVFYRSNRGGKADKQMQFSSEIPLWPGSNQVTVVARENQDVKSVQTLYLYREAPATAQAAATP